MACYLITGVAGFIGSSLAHALVTAGHEVRGIDNLSTGNLDNLADIRRDMDYQTVDLLDVDRLRASCEGVDYVLHQAAIASVPRSVKDPLGSHAANVEGTLNLLLAARDAGVGRVVFAASSSAYGNQPTRRKHEGMVPSPLSPYAAQKLACEHYVQSFWHVYGLEGVCLRYFNVFGPRQSADSPYSGVIARFVSDMLAGTTPTIFGSGKQSRDFTFIRNVVEANLLAAAAPRGAGSRAGLQYWHRPSASRSIPCMRSWRGCSRSPAPPRYAPERAGDIEHSEADISCARAAPRLRAGRGLRFGAREDRRLVCRTIAAYRTHTLARNPFQPCSSRNSPTGTQWVREAASMCP